MKNLLLIIATAFLCVSCDIFVIYGLDIDNRTNETIRIRFSEESPYSKIFADSLVFFPKSKKFLYVGQGRASKNGCGYTGILKDQVEVEVYSGKVLTKEIWDDEYKNPTDAVHMQDRRIIEEFNASAKDEYRLRLNLPPEPFQGNPLDAEVVILTLNPGFVEKCNVGKYNALTEAEQKEFVKAKCQTMSMQDELCVPDDDVINDIGKGYWKRKLKAALEIPDVNKKIAVIQFLGYFSTKYNAIPKKMFGGDEPLLYTQEYTIRLIHYLMQEEKVIIIARAEKEWYRHIPELEYYKKKVLVHYRNPTISPGNCIDKDNGWKLIEAALKK